MKISYQWLKKYIPQIPNEEELAYLITFKICELEEVEKLPNGDTVFDMKILPDRAHDLLSHRGVAREIAGILGLKIISDNHKKNIASDSSNLQIKIESPLCRRYMGRIIKGVEIGPSPKWLVEMLESIGQKSINNIVDITNFILFDMGQPIHAFDLDKLESQNIIVRKAKEGEKISLLSYDVSGKERVVELDENNLIIADGSTGSPQAKEPLAIAGVKGGTKAEVDDNTKNILIEVANFDPVSIRKTAREFGIQTDAVKRYENEITPNLCDRVMEEVSNLIKEICPNVSFEEVVDVYNSKPEEKKVKFTSDYISKVLGKKILDQEIEKILKNFNYNFSHQAGSWEILVPDNRLDITGAHDMVEEIGRVYGYENIPSVLPELNFKHKDNQIWEKIILAKNKLLEMDYKEVMTYALTDKGEISIMDSSSNKNFLRTNLTDGLKESIKLNKINLPLLDIDKVRVFEIGTVFLKSGEEIHVAYGDEKNISEMTLDKFILENSSSDAGLVSLNNKKGKEEAKTFKLWSIYPFITRDIAVWVPEETKPEELLKIYKEFGTELLVKEPKFFDQFTKDGKTSYAFRLVFQSYEKTLTDEQVGEIMQKIEAEIKKHNWQVR